MRKIFKTKCVLAAPLALKRFIYILSPGYSILHFIHALVLNLPLDGIVIDHLYSVPAGFFAIFPHFSDLFEV